MGASVAWLTGSMLVLALPAPLALEAALIGLFTASSWFELRAFLRGMARIDRIRITAGGEVSGITPHGEHELLEVMRGSMVLRHGAWLRLRFADGQHTAEWLSARAAGSEAWRLLHVLWRHRGGFFGRPTRS